MRIKICGFKCHLDIEYTFDNGQMTLIKGASATGKSSILQAIYWVLYGNMRSIYNNAGITKNLSVTLELPGITVFRKKNPELLTVETEEKSYEDAVAQSVIDSYFGSKEIWKACSYIEQKARCSLISGSGSERMELLNALSFTGESPKVYISKINDKLKEVNLEFTEKQSSFVAEINIYSEELNKRPIKVRSSLQETDILRREIENLEKEEKILGEQCKAQERVIGKYNYIKEEIAISEKKLASLNGKNENVVIPEGLYNPFPKPELDENCIITLQEYSRLKKILSGEINVLQNKLNRKERLDSDLKSVEDKLKRFENIDLTLLDKYKGIKEEDVWKRKEKENERERYLNECKNLGIEYDENVLKETLNYLTNQLSFYSNLERHITSYKKLLELENQLNSLKKITNDASISEIEKISSEKSLLISELKKGLEMLLCPKCSIPLRYRNGTLELGERNPVSSEEILQAEREYQESLKILENLRQVENLKENITILNKTIEGISKTELDQYLKTNENKTLGLTNFIKRISNIRYIEKGEVSSLELSNVYNYVFLKQQKENLENNREYVDDEEKIRKDKELEELERKYYKEQERTNSNSLKIQEHSRLESKRLLEIQKYEQKSGEIKRKELERENLSKEILKKTRELESMEDEIRKPLTEQHNYLLKQLNEKKTLLDESIYSIEMVKKGQKYEEKRNKLLELQRDVKALNDLKIKAIDIECKQLEETVNNINTVLETTLPIFFPDPISLKLLLYKKIKSKKDKVKPGLNLEIINKGFKYDNVNSLSGGEGDRVSLALLLALNSVSNSPLILLDECVSSLDGELKESCITAIKSIPNKTVICVDHDDSLEGFYDAVIKID